MKEIIVRKSGYWLFMVNSIVDFCFTVFYSSGDALTASICSALWIICIVWALLILGSGQRRHLWIFVGLLILNIVGLIFCSADTFVEHLR